MRRVLVNHARDRIEAEAAAAEWVDLDPITARPATDNDLLELDDALNRLANEFPSPPNWLSCGSSPG